MSSLGRGVPEDRSSGSCDAGGLTLISLSHWITTLSFIFGGCCSNAITLEQITSGYPQSGTLITFFQFMLISLYGLPKHITLYPTDTPVESEGRSIPFPRLKPRKIPLTAYLAQVALFYLISLINNAAFGYHIPMGVHIIFRSGGLIVSMLLGWLVAGKRYAILQVLSVLLVTFGVAITTLSASPTARQANPIGPTSTKEYMTGIVLLSLALLLSGFLGLVQDWTYTNYRQVPQENSKNDPDGTENPKEAKTVPAWQESMFYLHFLALPMFFFVRHDLLSQYRAVNAGPTIMLSLPLPSSIAASPFSLPSSNSTLNISLPKTYLPLLLNTLTQLLCVSGVHRLTTSVSSLTVTLILVVRKAVSLVISVVLFGDGGNEVTMMWGGAALVLIGTVGYSMGSGKAGSVGKKKVE